MAVNQYQLFKCILKARTLPRELCADTGKQAIVKRYIYRKVFPTTTLYIHATTSCNHAHCIKKSLITIPKTMIRGILNPLHKTPQKYNASHHRLSFSFLGR